MLRSPILIRFLKKLRLRYKSTVESPLTAYHCDGGSIICPLSVCGSAAEPLTEGVLVRPGLYNVNDHTFDLTKSGCYRFAIPGRMSRQVMVPFETSEKTVSTTQWFHGYGSDDDALTSEALLSAAAKRRVWVTCGKAAMLVVQLLELSGFKARFVSVLTLQEWNDYDNGHSLIEVLMPQGWVVFDPSFGGWPMIHGNHVNLTVLCSAVREGKRPEIRLLESGTVLGRFAPGKEDLSLWMESRWGQSKAIAKWYQRVAQVALIHDGGCCYFNDPDAQVQQRVCSYSRTYNGISSKQFIDRFYS